MELTEIEAYADQLLETLKGTESASEMRDLVFRLDGLYRGAQIKTLLPEVTPQGPCGFKWKWGQGREQHYEICTLTAGHDGTHHLNQVTGINKRKAPDCTCVWATRQAMSESNTLAGSHHDDTCALYLRNFAEPPFKPLADRLHELLSYLSGQAREGIRASVRTAVSKAYEDAAEKLEALLMEGGI